MKFCILVILASFLCVSCGGYNEGILQKSEKGFLKFSGNVETVKITIDDGEGFTLDPKIQVYQVKPGKHSIKAYRNDQLVLNRVVIVDNQTTLEIEIP